MNAANVIKALTRVKAMRLNVCTTKSTGIMNTAFKRVFLLPKIRAKCNQFLRIGALLTLRYKARNSTNKGGRAFSVVETMRRLILRGALFLTHYGVMKP